MNQNYTPFWTKITPEQKATLREWLLEQDLKYKEVLQRIRTEWGLNTSITSLCRYYQRLQREQMRGDLEEVKATLKTAQKAELNLSEACQALLAIITRNAMDAAMRKGDSKEAVRLVNVLLQHEQQKIQNGWLNLAREKFEFKASKAALKALPLVKEFEQEDMDREDARVHKIKMTIFGKKLVDSIIK